MSEAKTPALVSETDEDDLYGRYPAEVTNKTLSENNILSSVNDTHTYYNSSFSVDEAVGKSYWIDLDKHEDIQINQMLSKSHRRAAVSFTQPMIPMIKLDSVRIVRLGSKLN